MICETWKSIFAACRQFCGWTGQDSGGEKVYVALCSPKIFNWPLLATSYIRWNLGKRKVNPIPDPNPKFCVIYLFLKTWRHLGISRHILRECTRISVSWTWKMAADFKFQRIIPCEMRLNISSVVVFVLIVRTSSDVIVTSRYRSCWRHYHYVYTSLSYYEVPGCVVAGKHSLRPRLTTKAFVVPLSAGFR